MVSLDTLVERSLITFLCSNFQCSSAGKEWKRLRSAGKKQVIPRRVRNYAPTLGKFAKQLGDHLYTTRNTEGFAVDVQTELTKYAFQGEMKLLFVLW